MTVEELTKRIETTARSLGADRVGFASYESMDGAPEKRHPRDIFPPGKSLVVLVKRYLEATIDTSPSFYSALQYTQLNSYLERIAFDLSSFIEDEGYLAIPIPATQYGMRVTSYRDFVGVMSQRHAAVAAGLGIFGRNNLLITPDFGPRVRILTILTDAELVYSAKLENNICNNCGICVKHCPAKALETPEVNKGACMLNIMETARKTGGEGTCGVCMRVCPVARKAGRISFSMKTLKDNPILPTK
jgi:epoxyqueuosine reductase QueG